MLKVHVPVLKEDRVLNNDIEALKRMAHEGDFIKIVEKVAGHLS